MVSTSTLLPQDQAVDRTIHDHQAYQQHDPGLLVALQLTLGFLYLGGLPGQELIKTAATVSLGPARLPAAGVSVEGVTAPSSAEGAASLAVTNHTVDSPVC